MAERKQVMDIHANSGGITQAESNEQQRNWNDKMWSVKASDSLSNYDPTRKHLNFEVAKGGTIRQIDTSKSIAQKMAESLASKTRTTVRMSDVGKTLSSSLSLVAAVNGCSIWLSAVRK